jgi:hypothetical protein
MTATTFPLRNHNRHLFVEIDGTSWLLDTGAPTSFGVSPELSLAGEQFRLVQGYCGLTPATLSQFVGVNCAGLIGMDILGRLDLLIDPIGEIATFSAEEVQTDGQKIRLDEFMGIPIIEVRIGGSDYQMFFDTGAQISYFQEESLTEYPPAGTITDFYPGIGQFQTATHNVQISIGKEEHTLRCGTLPGLLGATLMMAGVQGIVGNQIIKNRKVGFFPRRQLLIL